MSIGELETNLILLGFTVKTHYVHKMWGYKSILFCIKRCDYIQVGRTWAEGQQHTFTGQDAPIKALDHLINVLAEQLRSSDG